MSWNTVIRLLADLNIASSTIAGLRADGHDVLALSETGQNPDDAGVLALAQGDARILLTEDQDFGTHLYRDRIAHSGLVRLEQVNAKWQLRMARRALADCSGELLRPGIVTVTKRKIRVTIQTPQP